MTVPRVADDWNDELSVTQPGDAGRGGPLMLLLGAMATTFGRLHDVVRDQLDGSLGWTQMLSPSRAPGWALPWLAQFAGVTLTPGLSEAEQRAQITSPPSFLRGTRVAIKRAVLRTLSSGTEADVRVVERVDHDPYRLAVITASVLTPSPAASTAAALSQKPLGLLLDTYVSTAPLLMEYTRTLSGVTATLAAATLADVT